MMWAPWEGPGLEHLRLVTSDGGVVANGLVIGLEAGRPFRIGYEIRCDGRWRVRKVRVATPDSERPVIEFPLLADEVCVAGRGQALCADEPHRRGRVVCRVPAIRRTA
jgi:hypothetical protein